MTKQFKGISLRKIAGVITFPVTEIVFRSDRENLPITKEEAISLLNMLGRQPSERDFTGNQ